MSVSSGALSSIVAAEVLYFKNVKKLVFLKNFRVHQISMRFQHFLLNLQRYCKFLKFI